MFCGQASPGAQGSAGPTDAPASSSADAGQSGGVPAWKESQLLYEDESVDALSKIALASAISGFLEKEAVNILEAEKPLEVKSHTTYNRVKASILTTCTCKLGPHGEGEPQECQIHCEEASLAEIVFAMGQEIFASFGDEFTCFANLFMETAGKGHKQGFVWNRAPLPGMLAELPCDSGRMDQPPEPREREPGRCQEV